MPKVALYARVSTTEQHPEVQLDALRAYAAARAFEIAEEYVDHGVSGSRAQRPALDRMMQDARRRRFDILAIVKLDRLARSVRHLTELAAEFQALGVDLVVLDQAIDTGTPSGRLLFHTLAAVAEFERDLIRERVSAGMQVAKRRGQKMGRPRALGPVELDRLRELHGAGHPIRTIARALEVGSGTVYREIERLGLRRAA